MRNGFLDNIPDLGIEQPRKRGKKKKPVPAGMAPVIYVKVRCPKCKSYKVPVYNTNYLPIRYHKCQKCGFCFKSIEKKT